MKEENKQTRLYHALLMKKAWTRGCMNGSALVRNEPGESFNDFMGSIGYADISIEDIDEFAKELRSGKIKKPLCLRQDMEG